MALHPKPNNLFSCIRCCEKMLGFEKHRMVSEKLDISRSNPCRMLFVVLLLSFVYDCCFQRFVNALCSVLNFAFAVTKPCRAIKPLGSDFATNKTRR